MLNRRLLAPALLAAALLPQAARAADAESSVTGQGDATIKKGAEAIRLTVALQVEGSSVHDAVAKLKTRREAVKAALVKLGAADATFDGGSPRVVDAGGGGDRRAAMERMIRERMGSRGGAAAATGPAAAAKVAVGCVVHIDWAIKGDADTALELAALLKDKVATSKIFDQPKAAASEADEEAAAMMGSSDEGNPMEPRYYFVAKFTEAERAKATAEAFAKAKTQAARLAKAAGGDIGALRSVTARDASQTLSDLMESYGYNNSYYVQRMLEQRGQAAQNDEVFSDAPGDISHTVSVQAAFALKS